MVVSKAMSWLLRHGAEKERIAMDEQGYINARDLLQWNRVKALKVDLHELAEVVGSNEKQRFGMKYLGKVEVPSKRSTMPGKYSMTPGNLIAYATAELDMTDPTTLEFFTQLTLFRDDSKRDGLAFPSSLGPEHRRTIHSLAHQMGLLHGSRDSRSRDSGASSQVYVYRDTLDVPKHWYGHKEEDHAQEAASTPAPETTSAGSAPEQQTDTQVALQHINSTSQQDLDPTHYLIRATQGHSLKTLDASTYLTPITLDDPTSIPDACVHGTFYAAWPRILESRGMKPMSRVHVHFATGPKLDTVLQSDGARSDGTEGVHPGEGKKTDVVISGMRGDAQILIYIDIRRALAAGVSFWRSENGVILTEGVGETKTLDEEFWDVVVETKAGLGVLWKKDVGIVKELTNEMKSRGMPRGKDRDGGERRGGRGQGRGGGKPRFRVEREGEDGSMQQCSEEEFLGRA